MEITGWLSEDELIFNRMITFHRERVDAIAAGSAPLGKHESGTLVVHLVPQSSVCSRSRFAGDKLSEYGRPILAIGRRSGRSRFNVDGLLNCDRDQGTTAYSQVFRDGRLEAAMTRVGYQQNGMWIFRGTECEIAVFDLVTRYLAFCRAIGLATPITLFSALLACTGFRFAVNPQWADLAEHSVDRSPVYLPEIEIPSLDIEPAAFMRAWCDTLWQAGGVERSYSYDEEGNRHE